MKKILASLFLFSFLLPIVHAQDNSVRPQALGVSFFLNDFSSAERLRTTSLSKVIADKSWAKFSEMAPGLAISYFKGLQKHLDFSSTLAASFVDYPFPTRESKGNDNLLLEADASINLKMFSDDYWFTPYFSAGIGGSKYEQFYGAFIPVGLGLKVNFFDEAALFTGVQYRIPVTYENTNYHFMYSIGVAGVIGKSKK
jgi:OOP family OmpA-OmpF porin